MDMKKREREGRQHVPVLGRLGAERLGQHVGDWWLAKNSRISANTSMPEDLGRHADVVERRDEPDTERVDQRRDDQRGDGDEREHVADAERRRAGQEVLTSTA